MIFNFLRLGLDEWPKGEFLSVLRHHSTKTYGGVQTNLNPVQTTAVAASESSASQSGALILRKRNGYCLLDVPPTPGLNTA